MSGKYRPVSVVRKIFCGGNAAFFVFPATCAAEKHLVSEKSLNKRFFKGTGVVLAGIERSPKIRDFRASGIPVQERVDFFDTLRKRKFSAPCEFFAGFFVYFFRFDLHNPLL